MKSSLHTADWLVPVSQPPLREGAVVVENGRIAWIGSAAELSPGTGSLPHTHHTGILTPGLVNAHTHLQYSMFATLGQRHFDSFEHWSDEFEALYVAVTSPSDWRESALSGARDSLRAGVTHVADIVTDRSAQGACATVGVKGVEYLEVIGQTERSWAAGERANFLEWWKQAICDDHLHGISPHAPYSLDASVIRDLVDIAGASNSRIHTHVAESFVEEGMYLTGDSRVVEIYGDLRDEFVLVRQGGVGLHSIPYADSLGLLDERSHIAHGIYVNDRGRELLRERESAVALCPRSNRTIGLADAPVADYLRERNQISVGTDSLSSTPSLDLLEDVSLLFEIATAQGYDDSDLATRLFEAATVGGARALGLAPGTGTLAQDVAADFSVFAVNDEDDPVHALTTRGSGTCTATYIDGQLMMSDGKVR